MNHTVINTNIIKINLFNLNIFNIFHKLSSLFKNETKKAIILKNNAYDRYRVYTISEGIEILERWQNKIKLYRDINRDRLKSKITYSKVLKELQKIKENLCSKPVRIYNAKYKLITGSKNNLICPVCGLKASYFALEKDKNQNNNICRLSLYGIDKKGVNIEFTIDHIKPKSKGGTSHPENYQLMCKKCNAKKGNSY